VEDIFLRKEFFEDEPWYNEFCIFLSIGVCTAEKPEYVEAIQDAISQMGFATKVFEKNGETYISGTGYK